MLLCAETLQQRTRYYGNKFLLFACLVISPFLVLAQETLEIETTISPLYNFTEPAGTIHSTQEGGAWYRSDTWVEGRSPEPGDVVIINGPVTITESTPIIDIHEIVINENSSLRKTYYGAGEISVDNIYIKRNSVFEGIAIVVNGDIYNYSNTEIAPVVYGNVYNYGTIPFVSLRGEGVKSLVGTESIESVRIDSDILIPSDLVFQKMYIGSYHISFDVDDSRIQVNTLLSARENSQIDAIIYTNPSDITRLDITELTTHELIIQHGAIFENEPKIFGNLTLKEQTYLRRGGYTKKTFTVHGDVLLETGSELSAGNSGAIWSIDGVLRNSGVISDEVYTSNDIYNSGTLKIIRAYGRNSRALEGLENTALFLEDNIIVQGELSIYEINFGDYFLSFEGALKVLSVYGKISGKAQIAGILIIPNTITVYSEKIYADLIIIESSGGISFRGNLHIYSNVVFKSGSLLSQSYIVPGSLYIIGDIQVETDVSFLNHNNRTPLYLYGSIDFKTNFTKAIFFLFNNIQGDTHTFEYGETITMDTVVTSEHPSIQYNDFISQHRMGYWRVQPNEDDFSDTFSINKKIYLEKNTNFFTIDSIPNHDYAESIYVTITAPDQYNGVVAIESSIDNTRLLELDIIGGFIESDIELPEPGEQSLIAYSGVLSGKSNNFMVTEPVVEIAIDVVEENLEPKSSSGGGSRSVNEQKNTTNDLQDKVNENLLEKERLEKILAELQDQVKEQTEKESDDDESPEIEYLLENQCLTIQSKTKIITRGDRTENSQNIQKMLMQYGYLDGVADGIFGNQTRQALIDFQKTHGLSADGVFGPGTSKYIDEYCNNLITKPGTQITENIKETVEEMILEPDKNNFTEDVVGIVQFGVKKIAEGVSEIFDKVGKFFGGLFGKRELGEVNSSDIKILENTVNLNLDLKKVELKPSSEIVGFISEYEDFSSEIYLDAVGLPTIGYGHLIKPGEDFSKGITKEEALILYQEDLQTYVDAVNKYIETDMSQEEFDAMVSLAYNIGVNAFSKSSVVRNFNNNNKDAAADSFSLWNKGTINGQLIVLPGLTNRRKDEVEIYYNINYERNY